jgi:hypothetical protein
LVGVDPAAFLVGQVPAAFFGWGPSGRVFYYPPVGDQNPDPAGGSLGSEPEARPTSAGTQSLKMAENGLQVGCRPYGFSKNRALSGALSLFSVILGHVGSGSAAAMGPDLQPGVQTRILVVENFTGENRK